MLAIPDFRDETACVISGDEDDLYSCPCIPREAAEEAEDRVAKREWLYCQPRGGLPQYLDSRENRVNLRGDISEMYNRAEFILAPTYKTYLDTMRFIELSGVKNRKEYDRTPRRPLTAMASPEGLYRYVFIPCTDAARALQKEFNLQPQTMEDLNGGICPVDNKPFRPGSDTFPVVECCAHPFSVSMLAWKTLCKRSTPLTGQWHVLVGRIIEQRHKDYIRPPQWFIDAPKLGHNDEELTPSEASGYLLSSCGNSPSPDPASIFRDTSIPETDSRKAIADWVCNKIDPKAAPPKEKPIRIAYKTRRSERLRTKACPYDRPPSPDGPPPSPTRNGPRTIVTCRRDLTHLPPAWTGHNGEFPTDRFSSNDWAFFCYNVNLAYTPPKKP